MEDDQKSKHTCKFCHKIFPCGRSLGGHMRSHLKKQNDGEEKPINVDDRLCKECGRSFQSWKSLFGHMKRHSVIRSVEEDSRNSLKPTITADNMSSDNEAATLCRKKRSERDKMCKNPCADQEEQEEEVALSLILLSMDCVSSVVESHNTSSEPSEAKTAAMDTKSSSTGADPHSLKFKKLDTESRTTRKRVKNSDNLECEFNSPKILIKKTESPANPIESDHKKRRNSSKKKCIGSNSSEMMNGFKFRCIICKKGFPSYQALGGHRASHKKFKGCCAPTADHVLASDFQEKNDAGVVCTKSKEQECLICCRVFPSGQALGGHKRSHLISDEAKNTNPSVRKIPEIHSFLDLNLPAPSEEDCNEFKAWWIGTSHNHHHQPLLGLLSSSSSS